MRSPWPRKPELVVVLLASIAAPLVFGFLVVSPERRDASSLHASSEEQEAAYLALRARCEDARKTQEACTDLRAEVAEREQSFFGPRGALVHERLQAFAGLSGVTVESFYPDYNGARSSGRFRTLSIELALAGSYHQTAMFINLLENSGGFGVIERFQIAAAADQPGQVRAKLTVRSVVPTEPVVRPPELELVPTNLRSPPMSADGES